MKIYGVKIPPRKHRVRSKAFYKALKILRDRFKTSGSHESYLKARKRLFEAEDAKGKMFKVYSNISDEFQSKDIEYISIEDFLKIWFIDHDDSYVGIIDGIETPTYDQAFNYLSNTYDIDKDGHLTLKEVSESGDKQFSHSDLDSLVSYLSSKSLPLVRSISSMNDGRILVQSNYKCNPQDVIELIVDQGVKVLGISIRNYDGDELKVPVTLNSLVKYRHGEGGEPDDVQYLINLDKSSIKNKQFSMIESVGKIELPAGVYQGTMRGYQVNVMLDNDSGDLLRFETNVGIKNVYPLPVKVTVADTGKAYVTELGGAPSSDQILKYTLAELIDVFKSGNLDLSRPRLSVDGIIYDVNLYINRDYSSLIDTKELLTSGRDSITLFGENDSKLEFIFVSGKTDSGEFFIKPFEIKEVTKNVRVFSDLGPLVVIGIFMGRLQKYNYSHPVENSIKDVKMVFTQHHGWKKVRCFKEDDKDAIDSYYKELEKKLKNPITRFRYRHFSSDDSSKTKYVIVGKDSEGNLKKLIEEIRTLGNGGHSFSIVVDPESENPSKFFWDGDGADRIDSIEDLAESIDKEFSVAPHKKLEFFRELDKLIKSVSVKDAYRLILEYLIDNAEELKLKDWQYQDFVDNLTALMNDTKEFSKGPGSFSNDEQAILHAILDGVPISTYVEGIKLIPKGSVNLDNTIVVYNKSDDSQGKIVVTYKEGRKLYSDSDDYFTPGNSNETEYIKINPETGEWGIISAETGEWWDASYGKGKEGHDKAHDAMQAYHVSKNKSFGRVKEYLMESIVIDDEDVVSAMKFLTEAKIVFEVNYELAPNKIVIHLSDYEPSKAIALLKKNSVVATKAFSRTFSIKG